MPRFFELVQKGRTEAVRDFLESKTPSERRLILRAVDPSGFTALHNAAGNGHIDVVEMLIAYGADPNAQGSRFRVTPMHLAAAANHGFVIEKLAEKGADPNIENSEGQNPLELILNKPFLTPKSSLVGLVKVGATFPAVKIINYKQAVMHAASEGDLDVIRDLKEFSETDPRYSWAFPAASVDVLGLNGYVSAAVRCLSVDLVRYLVEECGLSLNTSGLYASLLRFNIASKVALAIPDKKFFGFPAKLLHDSRNPTGLLEDDHSGLKELLSSVMAIPSIKYIDNKLRITELKLPCYTFEFDKDGRCTNSSEFLERLSAMLDYLKAKGIDINAKRADGVSMFSDALSAPKQALDLLAEKGVRFSLQDLHNALFSHDGTVVVFILENCEQLDILNKGPSGKTAREIVTECENETLLDSRPEIFRLIESHEAKHRDRIAASSSERVSSARASAAASGGGGNAFRIGLIRDREPPSKEDKAGAGADTVSAGVDDLEATAPAAKRRRRM